MRTTQVRLDEYIANLRSIADQLEDVVAAVHGLGTTDPDGVVAVGKAIATYRLVADDLQKLASGREPSLWRICSVSLSGKLNEVVDHIRRDYRRQDTEASDDIAKMYRIIADDLEKINAGQELEAWAIVGDIPGEA